MSSGKVSTLYKSHASNGKKKSSATEPSHCTSHLSSHRYRWVHRRVSNNPACSCDKTSGMWCGGTGTWLCTRGRRRRRYSTRRRTAGRTPAPCRPIPDRPRPAAASLPGGARFLCLRFLPRRRRGEPVMRSRRRMCRILLVSDILIQA